MVTLILTAILTGGALGLTFRVLILVPITLIAIGLLAIAGFAGRTPFALVAQEILAVSLALQAGYCLGLATRHVAIVARAPALRKAMIAARRLGRA